MAADVLNTVAAQLEVVLPEIQQIYEESDELYGRVRRTAQVQQISRYLFRIPLMKGAGGNTQKVSGNGGTGGSLGHGTSMVLDYLLAGYFYSNTIFQLTEEQIDTSASQTQSVVDVMSKQMSVGLREVQIMDDIAFHTTGTGILTNPSSATTNSTNATMTFASPTDTLNVNMLREYMCVDVWDSTGATQRVAGTGAPIIITAIDYDAKVVTLNQTVTSLTTGDILAIRNLNVYGPSTLTTFNSTYPGTQGGAPTGGIGGDSFRHGFPYMTDTNSANYFYGKLKSSVPQLNPVAVNANNNTLQWEHGLRIISKIQQKRSKEDWMALTGIAHMTQRASVFELGTSLSQKMFTEGNANFGTSFDNTPTNKGYTEEYMFAGIPCMLSKRQDRSRVDFINFNKLGRAQVRDIDYYKPGGQIIHPGRGSDGTLQTFVEWSWILAYDNVCFDNGAFGRISSLAPPSQEWDA